jgi:hypothetical protein
MKKIQLTQLFSTIINHSLAQTTRAFTRAFLENFRIRRDLQILPISLVTPIVVHTSIINDYCKQFLIVAFNSLLRSSEFIRRILKFLYILFPYLINSMLLILVFK